MKKNLYKELVYKQSIDRISLNVARQLYLTRKARGFTVKKLSHLSGVSVKIIKQIERTHLMKQTITDLFKISHALDIAFDIRLVPIDQTKLCDIKKENYIIKSFTEEFDNV